MELRAVDLVDRLMRKARVRYGRRLQHRRDHDFFFEKLPEEGQHLAAADAIREGILAAYFARPAPERPELRFVAAPADAYRAAAAVQEAAQAGAAVAIGPLDKAAVTQLANSAALPIPVLALNQGETAGSPPPNLYQFALAPAEAAARIAARLSLALAKRPMSLSPSPMRPCVGRRTMVRNSSLT